MLTSYWLGKKTFTGRGKHQKVARCQAMSQCSPCPPVEESKIFGQKELVGDVEEMAVLASWQEEVAALASWQDLPVYLDSGQAGHL